MTELFQSWLLKIALGGGCVCVTTLIAIVARRQLDEVQKMVRRLPVWERTLIVGLLAVCIAHGGSKTNVVDGAVGTNAMWDCGIVGMVGWWNGENGGMGEMRTVMPEDIARGWQKWEVRTNSEVCYTMPGTATMASNWWMRGAYEDCSIVRLGDCEIGGNEGQSNNQTISAWSFPFGSNEYSSVWALTWGKLRFELAKGNTEIAAVGSPMSAVPYRSRLWFAVGTNGSRIVTWENFALNRDTNTPVNAQIELAANGDFTTRSNEVEFVYRRVDPEDWDGDGWRNGDDPDPYTWDDPWDDFYQELPDGANEDAYCWIEIRPRWHSYINFVGDGQSDLPDPILWAKAGKTYRVQLLIGKTYFIESTQSLDVVGQSDSSIEVDGDGTSEINVVWPVQFAALAGNGSGFRMRVIPACLGGTFVWTNSCCPITGSGVEFWYAHCGSCGCGGCYASGEYRYQGYCLSCTGGWCDCPYNDDDDPYGSEEDDGPYASGASVSFSDSVVIFEDAYTNMPGEVVARQSTRTTLTCVAHGGDTGGTATFSIENGDKLVSCSGGSLPVARFVPPLQKVEFEIVYEGQLPSGGEEDIIAKADFTERGTGTRHSTVEDEMTSVKVELEASYTAVDNPSKNRHIFGVGEEAELKCIPALTTLYASSSFGMIADMRNGRARYVAPPEEDSPVITINCGSVQKEITIDIFEPEEYVVCSIATNFIYAPNEAGLIEMDFTNRVFPTYVSFYAIEVTEIPMVSTNAIGYFAQPEHADDLDHGKRGAYGQWSRINEDNSTSDEVRMGYCAKPWNGGGSYTWPIPNAWRVSSHNWETNIFTQTDQRFELDADGTARVSKFGWTGERGTNDAHRVYGGTDR